MFGRRFSEYLAFQKWFLVAIAVVGIGRLALSLAGVGDATTGWLSMQAVWLGGFLYYALAVQARGFGGFKQIFPLLLNQTVLVQAIAIAGIAIAILSGHDNVFTAAEYTKGGFAPRSWGHAFGHVIGTAVFPLLFWALSWPLFAVSRRLSSRAAPAAGSVA